MAVPYISEVLIPTPGTASTSWVATGCGYQKYEAVALGLVALRDSDWVAGVPEGLAAVRVSVTSIPIEHAVKMQDIQALGRAGRRESKRGSRHSRATALKGSGTGAFAAEVIGSD